MGGERALGGQGVGCFRLEQRRLRHGAPQVVRLLAADVVGGGVSRELDAVAHRVERHVFLNILGLLCRAGGQTALAAAVASLGD